MDDQLERLLDLLDRATTESVGTSVRVPANLHQAVAVATDLGLTPSASELTVQGLRDALEARVQRALLEAHYAEHPQARPDLQEVALAAAELDGSPLADRPDLVRHAAENVRAIKQDVSADDVLLYAAGLMDHAA